MSATEVLNLSENENNCVVCFKNVDIYSIGTCDHPVCFECSTRMRVLCGQIECPICRQPMSKVVYTKEVEPFNVLKQKVDKNLQDEKYGLYFITSAIQRRYNRLLEHECLVCKRNGYNQLFRTFQQLKDHMRRTHELFYCDICISNLKIFTFERSFYTRAELATHRRKGDPDNTSHRGHPLCEFCEIRFMDNDELFRHLRRDHLYCHFCDVDGKHQYYNSYDDLRKHYLDEHYLCEEGDCKYEKFISVFRTDIDLKAHYAAIHGKNLSKAANRQARTLEFEFTLAPRNRPELGGRGGRNYSNRNTVDRQNEEDGAFGFDVEPGGPGDGENDRLFSNPLAAENFPSLNGNNTTVSSGSRTTVSNVTITSKFNPLSDENFPTLNGSSSAPLRSSAVTISAGKFKPKYADFPSLGTSSSGGNAHKQPAVTITSTIRGQPNTQRNLSDFPTLHESSAGVQNSRNIRVSAASAKSGSVRVSVARNVPEMSKTSNVSIRVNHKPNGAVTTHISQSSNTSGGFVHPKSTEAFPALSIQEPVRQQPQWVQQKSRKQHGAKAATVASAPVLPPNGLKDFPKLSKGGKIESAKVRKSTSITVPVSNTWVNLNSFNSDAKNNSNITTATSSDSSKSKVERIQDSTYNLNAFKTGDGKVNENLTEGKNKKKKNKNLTAIIDSDITKNTNKMCISDAAIAEKNVRNTTAEEDLVTNNQENKVPNEITKKRSELNISALEINELPGTSKINKPPPGFNVKPPPGFSNFTVTNNTLPNDLTFTNSSGQSYSIIPSQQFYPPPNFKSRNQFLIEKFKVLQQDTTVIQQFKIYSEMFRAGDIPSEEYYKHCCDFMGNEFATIFPELLALLPNVEKQQELFKVHLNNCGAKGLEACATCRQIILSSDLRNHLANHILNSHFPVLNNQTSPENNNVWHKK